MWMKAVLAVACLATSASAQVIYEPTRVQHGGHNTYYYAGSNAHIHEAARFPSAPGANWGRVNGYAFVNARSAVVQRQPRIFTDAFGTFDARVYGMTIDDVVNEAKARLPRYFSKAELLASADVEGETRIVRPDATPAKLAPGTILIKPSAPPIFRRGPVLVVPKSMMDRKVGDVVGSKDV